jgi:hypothetical protein
MFWNMVKEEIERREGSVYLNQTVCGIERDGNRITSVRVLRNGFEEIIEGTDFISSMPITEFIKKLNPPPPAEVLEAVSKLSYRDFLTVCLIVDRPHLFDDNWIYIHEPDVVVGRIQNFKNWSPYMVPDSTKTSLGLEYFCNEGDELWNAPDDELIELGKQEVDKIGLANCEDVLDGCVFRVEKSYPVYDSSYREYMAVIREYIDSMENFQTIGRNGLHRYNNQDHAMLTGMLAVRNLILGENHNLWIVNAEQEYHEEIREEPPARDVQEIVEDALARAFMKLDPRSFGFAWGSFGGLLLFFLTLIILNNSWYNIGEKISLINQFFPRYTISLGGSLLGLFYGFVSGFVGGWGFAFLRNMVVLLYMAIIHRRAQLQLLRKILDF